MGTLKEKMKPAKVGGGMSVPRIKKGETIITLTNIHTGEKKVYHDTNMQTNALNYYLANCGWLNRDNLQDSSYRNRLAEEILGGVMLFDTALPANADCIKVPAGTTMIANCALGAVNTDAGTGVTELGTCSTSPTETGRINGKFMVTYRWNDGQGNGTIRSLSACPIKYAMAGEGNALSKERTSTRYDPRNLAGTTTNYMNNSGMHGWPFGVDLEKSIVYTFDLTDASTNHYGVLRKYRLPISKVNLWGTQSAVVQLPMEYDGNNDPVYDKHITLSETFYQFITGSGGVTAIKYSPFNGNLMMWNVAVGYNDSSYYNERIWGDNWTQYLWTLEPDGTLTQETLANTSGDELHCMENPIFDGDYIFFCWNYYQFRFEDTYRYQNDTRTIYVLNRTTGTIDKITNEFGDDRQGTFWNIEDLGQTNSGWMPYMTSGDGRLYISGYSKSYVVDAVLKKTFVTIPIT